MLYTPIHTYMHISVNLPGSERQSILLILRHHNKSNHARIKNISLYSSSTIVFKAQDNQWSCIGRAITSQPKTPIRNPDHCVVRSKCKPNLRRHRNNLDRHWSANDGWTSSSSGSSADPYGRSPTDRPPGSSRQSTPANATTSRTA